MSEHDHQVFVFQVLALNESLDPRLKWIYAIPNGGHRHPATAGKLKAEGVKRGISDICLPFPGEDQEYEYHGAYIEQKDGKNKPTKEQDQFLSFIAEQGYLGFVSYSADATLDFIEGYMNVKLRGRK